MREQNKSEIDISIKKVPREKVERLRLRAKRNHRSLQGELHALIDAAIENASQKLSLEEVAVKIDRLGLTRRDEAARLVREDRDR
jgi:hypothetical protein